MKQSFNTSQTFKKTQVTIMLLFLLPIFSKQLKRLNQPLTAEKYMLYIDVDMDKELYNGKVDIKINVFSKISKIQLFSAVKIKSVAISSKPVKFREKEDSLFLYEKLNKGVYILQIEFWNEIGRKMNGFYKSKGGIWSTHFEPGHARKAFPCFDQPDMKSVFKIFITAPKEKVVLSNMDVENETEYNDRKMTEFHETPKMSTYLVAWAIGPFAYIENDKIRVYSTKDKYKNGRFALEIATDCLTYFENYFKIPYPLKKLDLVAIPEFSMGAMENWGLITFRESGLLFFEDGNIEDKSSITSKKGIAETVCHEIAHQWYGNLVTMEWWNDIWLNEGFATWASNKAISKLKFKWDNRTYFLEYVMSGMENDGYHSSHPIENKEDPDQIFDTISYAKSSGIIKMVEDYDENFNVKIAKYLKKWMYKNSTSLELTEALEVDIDKWTKEKGFPMVTIKKDGTLIQERFTYLKRQYSNDVIWNIPVKIDWLDGLNEFITLKTKSKKIKFKTELFKVNPSGVGFYRVMYEDETIPLKLIERGLNDLDKVHLINDVYSLVIR